MQYYEKKNFFCVFHYFFFLMVATIYDLYYDIRYYFLGRNFGI